MRFCLICGVSWEKEFSFSSSIRLLVVVCRKERADLNYEWPFMSLWQQVGSGGLLSGGTGCGRRHRERPSSCPRWLLSQRRSEGLGGLESQPSSILRRSTLQAPGDQKEPGVLAGDAAVLTRPLPLGSPAAVPEETADSGHRPGAAEQGTSRV